MKSLVRNHKCIVSVLLTLLIVFGTYSTGYGQALNKGEPRTVRLFYFSPNDLVGQDEVVEVMKTGMLDLQTFFADQMEAHGHGRKTFQLETDDQDELIVHRVDGQHPFSSYKRNVYLALAEIGETFDNSKNISLTVIDSDSPFGTSGLSRVEGKSAGWGTISGGWSWGIAAHELAHAFGLHHDFHDSNYILSYGQPSRSSAKLSACAAEFLSVHPYFNSDIPLEAGQFPTIELISVPEYPHDAESVPIRLRVQDDKGLHQVFLFVEPQNPFLGSTFEVKACRTLAGETDTVVEFNFDGKLPSDRVGTPDHLKRTLSNVDRHLIGFGAVDTEGNASGFSTGHFFERRSPYHITSLKHTNHVEQVVFLSDRILASVVINDGSIKLWDITTHQQIATLEAHRYNISSIALSRDGTTLVSENGNQIKVWDVATRTNIATFSGREIGYIGLSPDGTTLASGSDTFGENAVRLWDIATQTNTSTLQGHTGVAASLAFSPDGTTLASGSSDNTIKLWDIATRTNTATLQGHTGAVRSVVFSPDGTTLASGSIDNTVRLWDVATQTNIATLQEHTLWVTSVVFSPDGTTLASASADNTVKLWNVATQTNITTLEGHKLRVTSVAFSPDGTTLASASADGTVKLWDVSEWSGTPAVNTAPMFTDGTNTTRAVAENTAANVNIGTAIAATDADNDTLTYTLGGTDAASFDIDGTTGQLQTKAALDYETKTAYTVTVTVSDGSLTDTITVTINITDVVENRAPVFTAGTSTTRAIAENTATSTNIGTAIAATDADTGDTLTYTLSGTDAASFSIVSTSGQLQTKAALDYETKISYSITVTVSDGNGGSDSITVTINVTDVTEGTINPPISQRTPQVRDAIVRAAGVQSAADVTEADLTGIWQLDLESKSITSLKVGDFNGLTSLRTLSLRDNQLTTLPVDIFDGLTALTTLNLEDNQLSTLPAGIFTDLTELIYLSLADNRLTTLPAGIFEGPSALWDLWLDGNRFTTLPTGLFKSKSLASGFLSLRRLYLEDNTVDPLPLTLSLEKVADGQFKAVAPAGATFDIVLPISVTNGSINGGATTVTISKGSVESGTLTVTRTAGTTADVTVDIGVLPRLPSDHQGYALRKSTDLPLEIISDINTAPVFTDGTSTTRTIAENTAANTNIGTAIAATDADNDTLTYTLGGIDAASFRIVSTTGQLQTKAALDYETKASYSVTVTVSDSNGGSDSITVTINVIDLNDTVIVPTAVPVANRTSQVRDAIIAAIPGVSAANQVTPAHLAAITSLNLRNAGITALRADDLSGMTALTDLNLFNNQLSRLPDGIFAGLTSLTTVRLGRNAVDPLPITVRLEKVVEGQFRVVVPTGATFNYVLPINVANGSINGGVTTVTIPQGTMMSEILTVTRTAGTTGHVMVDIGAFPRLPSTHYGYALVKSNNLPLAVIRGANTAPVFSDGTNATRSIAENTASGVNIGAPVSATDADSDTLTYTFSGTDAAAFSIISSSGQLQTRAALDYETKVSYTVTVAVSDGYGGSDRIPVTINVTDVIENRAPVFTEGSSITRTIAENTAANINIGTVIAATDADNDRLTYTLSGTNASAFAIDRNTGQLRTKAALDYETKRSYSVTVTVSDGRLTDTITVTINITDAVENRAPVFTDGTSTTRTIAENTAASTNIGTAIAATDADNDTLTYTLGGTDASSFSIVSTSGQLQTKAALDYETKSTYTVTLTVSDGSLTDTIDVTINITDINELPTTTAICKVGDVIAPGESCTYPGTDAVFSVLADGSSQWNIPNFPLLNKVSLGGSMSFTADINNENYHFVAKEVSNNSWEIKEIGDDTNQQPDPPEQPDDTGGTLTLSASTAVPLTEATLHEGIVTLTLNGGTYEQSTWRIRDAVSVAGITGIALDTFDTERISDTKLTVKLEFDGNINTDSTLTITLGAGAIADYNSAALTAQIPVTAVSESVTASTVAPLTEATLDEGVVTLTLSGRKFERWNSRIRPAVSVSGISGVTVRSSDIDRVSDTEVTVELTFNGNLNTDSTLTLTVGAGAIAGYNGPDFTVQVSVTASTDAPADTGNQNPDPPQTPQQPGNQDPPQQPANTGGTPTLSVSTAAPLTEAMLHGGVITLTLSNGIFERSMFWIRNAISVSGITGVDVESFGGERISDTQATIELEYDGNMAANSTLTISLEADGIKDYDGATLTAQIQVTAVAKSVAASTAAPLKEATLDGSVVTLTLNGAKYERFIFDIRGNVTVSGITGVTIPWNQPKRKSDTELTIALEFDGDMTRDGTLTFTVDAEAIAGYNGPAFTAQVTVTAGDAPADTGNQNPDPPQTPQQPGNQDPPQQPVNTGGTPTLTVSTTAPLTEVTLHGSVVTLTLSGGVYIRSEYTISRALTVSGIQGATFNSWDVDRINDTQVTVELTFKGDFDTDTVLTFTLKPGAIEGYDGPDFTKQIPVSGGHESITASITAPLMEETLHGSTVTLTLSGRKFVKTEWNISKALTVSGIQGATFNSWDVDRINDTQVTVKLTFAIAGYDGPTFTAQIPVSAIQNENALLANFPNPFNPETWIPYQLEKPTEVTITIYAIDGQVVRTLALGHQPAGMYQTRSRAAYWDGRNAFGEPVASGVYFYTLTVGDFSATRKMLIRK